MFNANNFLRMFTKLHIIQITYFVLQAAAIVKLVLPV